MTNIAESIYNVAVRMLANEEKTEKLCAHFSMLDEKDQEYIFGVLQALLFAKLKMSAEIAVAVPALESEKI